MEILTLQYKALNVEDVLKEDMQAYEYPVKHFVSTYNGNEIFLTGYRNGRLVYAIKTTLKTYKREAKKIERYIKDAVNNNIMYNDFLKEDCFFEKRVILYSSEHVSLLIDHYLQLTKNRIFFIEQNIRWQTVEEWIGQYEIALEENKKPYIPYYRDSLEMLRSFDFMWLSNNPYILSLFNRYMECLKRDLEDSLWEKIFYR